MIFGIQPLKDMLSAEKVYMDDNVYDKILMDINSKTNRSERFHVAILVDEFSTILSYGINEYHKTDSYPFSKHAEISCLTKYYGKKLKNWEKSRKKILIVIRLSPKRLRLGNSAPCRHCACYIENNMENINIKKIIYTTPDGLEVKKSKDFNVDECKLSSGHRAVKENLWVSCKK